MSNNLFLANVLLQTVLSGCDSSLEPYTTTRPRRNKSRIIEEIDMKIEAARLAADEERKRKAIAKRERKAKRI